MNLGLMAVCNPTGHMLLTPTWVLPRALELKGKWMQQWDTGTQPCVPCVDPQHNSMVWCHCVTFWVSHTRPDEGGPVRGQLKLLLLKRAWIQVWCCSAMDRHPPGLQPTQQGWEWTSHVPFPQGHTWFSPFRDPPLS